MNENVQYVMLADQITCSGCSACAMVCSAGAIMMKADAEGFVRPSIEWEKCIHCEACGKVCPVLRKFEDKPPMPQAYAARALDYDLKRTSSSGGIFYLLGEQIIQRGGVVFGCVIKKPYFTVQHACAETRVELAAMKGAKYVQSDMGDCFKKVKQLLLRGRLVLFSGTPCQVLGLKSYLGTQEKNLITVTFICHGVPSPAVYEKYLKEVNDKGYEIQSVSFRDKTYSWRLFSMALGVKGGRKIRDLSHDPFLRVFLANLCLRPSCYHCLCQNGRNGADITLADFWGVVHFTPEMDDNMGTSYVLVHTSQGEELWKTCLSLVESRSVPFDATIQYNRAYFESPVMPSKRADFFRLFQKRSLASLGDYLIDGAWYKRYPRRFYNSIRKQIGNFLRKIGVR